MWSPGAPGRRAWAFLIFLAAAFAAWESARYTLGGGRRGRFHVEGPYFILVGLSVLLCLLFCRAASRADRPARGRFAYPGRVLGAFALWSLVLYWPALSLGFLSDDFVLVDRAQRGQALDMSPGGFWRPLPLWLFGFLSRGGPMLLHLLNVLLHGTNGWLVARIARSMALSPTAAIFSGFVFLTFPASVEPVAWCSGIQDVLMTTAVLAGLAIWGESWALKWRTLVCLLALGVAVATKETGVVLPLLGLVVWSGRLPWKENVAITVPLAVVAATYSAWRVLDLPLPDHYAHFPTRFIAKELLARSFGGLSVPYHSDLGMIGFATALATGIVMPLLLALNAIIWRDDRQAFHASLRAALLVVAAVIPVYRYFHMAPDLEGSRYFYLPSAGWAILIVGLSATGLSKLRVGRRTQVALGVLAVLAWATVVRVHLVPWTEAADLREETVREAMVVMAANGCGPGSSFQDVPDSVRGAYVFRNGFPEVMSKLLPLTGAPCHLRWIEGSFTAVGN